MSSNIENTLIYLSNLAIPRNDKVEKGLGDLLDFNIKNDSDICPINFANSNHNNLKIISNLLINNSSSYSEISEKIYKTLGSDEAKNFLEKFRVFAIKQYFSHPFVIKKLKLYESFEYDKVEKEEDQLILSSLINNERDK